MKIKKNDNVIVIAGKDKGKTGKVLAVFPRRERVLVEHINMVKKHSRPRRQGELGGIQEREAPIHASNVMLFDPRRNKGVRSPKSLE
ncbi:MAG: 50S ribosomal protein L24 [Candidatus Omnitrophica bacterium]|nr:50S ribosomal protein L24 [Candidatus Omnitrophota bacterium]